MRNKPKIISVLLCLILSVTPVAAEERTMEERVNALILLTKGEEETEEEFVPENYVFIGDSRTVGMQQSVPFDQADSWSAEVSMGYDWMVSTGIPAVENAIDNGTAVYILMGINDLGNVNAYLSYVDAKAEEWNGRGAKTFFCAVGPVGNTTVTNGQIEAFNSVIKSGLSYACYLDIYGMLVSDGFSTQDGLHYTGGTYAHIYDYLKSAA